MASYAWPEALPSGGERDVLAPAVRPTLVRICLGVAIALCVVYAVLLFAPLQLPDSVRDLWVYDSVTLAAAGAAGARAWWDPRQRMAWAAIAVGLLCNVVGDLYYGLVLVNMENPPYPSVADVAYLSFYVCVYVAVLLILRSRITRWHARGLPRVWLTLGVDGSYAASAAW